MKYALISKNEFKAAEFQDALGRYGHIITRVDPDGGSSIKVQAHCLLTEGYKVVFAEKSLLSASVAGEAPVEEFEDAAIVYHISDLRAWFINVDDEVESVRYVSNVKGFIDLSLASFAPDVFGWDDVFVPLQVGDAFHSLKGRNMKNSARQMNLGKFSVANLFYDKRLDLNFSPVEQSETVDFTGAVVTFLKGDTLMRAGVEDTLLENVVDHVIQGGVFFRSAKNRREKNYWLPGLNAGIPLTAKKDKVHETTFMFHDLMHFQFPDLVFDRHTSMGRRVYLLHRMMGEAITLVLADMIFVDNLRKSGVDYDWSKRKIYPLLQALDLDPALPGDLRALLHANMRYALFGDDNEYRAHLQPVPDALMALEDYKAKYSRFFAEDWRWTVSNYENMREQEVTTSEWVEKTAGVDAFSEVGVPLLSRFTETLAVSPDASSDLIADAIFSHLVDDILFHNMRSPIAVGSALAASNAFKRYLIGQLSLFTRYRVLLNCDFIAEKLRKLIVSGKVLSQAEISAARKLVSHYVEELVSRNIISSDDGAMYSSMHPVFKPFYVFYDAVKEVELAACHELYLAD
jgi:adenylate kinase